MPGAGGEPGTGHAAGPSPRGARPGHGRPAGLGDRVELDGPAPLRDLLRRPAGRRRARPRRDRVGDRRAAASPGLLAFLVVGSAAGRSSAAGCSGSSGRSSTTASATGCSSTSSSATAAVPALPGGPAARPARHGHGRLPGHARVGVLFLGVRIDPSRSLAAPRRLAWRSAWRRSWLSGSRWPASASSSGGGLELPGGDRRRPLPPLRRDLPARRPAPAPSRPWPSRCPRPGGWRGSAGRSWASRRRPAGAFRRRDGPAALCATTAVLTLAGWAVFRSSSGVARERGLIDQTTGS